MLKQLAIKDVVLVDRLELAFERGLGVLTGETGAGKSILLDAFGLALGARADAGLVRNGQESPSVSAELDMPAGHAVHALLAEHGVECAAGEPLLLRRTLKSDGGSRAFAGGTAVNAAVLRDIAAVSVEIHGQHDDRGLLNSKSHRQLLDAFGKIDAVPVAAAWAEVTRLERELAQARAEAAEADRDRDWLTHASAEIEALAPEAGEETWLAEERAAIQAGVKAGEA